MSTTPNALYTALLAFQRAVGPVKKDASNPAFRTKYATLQSVLETVEDPLSDNGLVLLQRFEAGEGGPVLVTEVVHAATGDRVSSYLPIVSKDPTDPQKLGGAITYARRYSLLALLGLAPEDDDGNAASQPRSAPQAQRTAPQPPTQQRPVQAQPAALPALALALDDPLAPMLAELRAMETRKAPWHEIKKYADEQKALADDYGKQQITATLHAIAARRKAAGPMAPVVAGAAG